MCRRIWQREENKTTTKRKTQPPPRKQKKEKYYDKYEDDSPQGADQNSGECIVAKNRHGEARTVKMHWQGEFMRFTGTEDRSE